MSEVPKDPIRYGSDEIGEWLEFDVPTGDGVVTHRMRKIPAGSFMMGSPAGEGDDDEHPRHKVTLSEFWLSETECTQALYKAVTGRNPSEHKGERRPVETVSWDDAQAFIKGLNELVPGLDSRLPTEAEWEYSCRAGNSEIRYGELNNIAWHGGNSDRHYEVGGKQANVWGLHDMLGNVWEWCADGKRVYNSEQQVNPIGSSADGTRVRRGGSWRNLASVERAAFRSDRRREHRDDRVGFRLARGQAAPSKSNKSNQEAGPGLDEPTKEMGTGDRLDDAQPGRYPSPDESWSLLPWAVGIPVTGVVGVVGWRMARLRAKALNAARNAPQADLFAADPVRTGSDAVGDWLEFDVPVGDGVVTSRMRKIPAGSFMMGSPKGEGFSDQHPQHKVTLSEFWLGETVCTQALYRAVTGADPSEFKGDQRPVENVSWDDAQVFITRLNEIVPGLNARLPTEAEWEYGCRANTTGGRYERINYIAWHASNSASQTHDVGGKQANAWGLHDMLGNVWEWCADGRRKYNREPLTNPIGPTADDSRVSRGGSWLHSARFARAAYRDYYTRFLRESYLGFRLARGQAEESKQAGPQLDGTTQETQTTKRNGVGASAVVTDITPNPRSHLLKRNEETEATKNGSKDSTKRIGDRRSGEAVRTRIPSHTRSTSTVKLEFLCLRDDPFLFDFRGEERYRRPDMGWTEQFKFDWSERFLRQLSGLYDGENAADAREIGRTIADFLKRAGYEVPSDNTRVDFCAEATELYVLPLELARAESGRWLGLSSGSSITYRWPNTYATKQQGGDNGRVLLVWSDAAGSVPRDDHVDALMNALSNYKHRWLRFNPDHDVLERPSLVALNKRLREADERDQPIRVLHVLCHGSPLPHSGGYGLALEMDGAVISPDTFANVVMDYASMIRIVVLCVCHGGDTTLGHRVGSVAQELHRRGVATVVASRYPLRFEDSVALTRTLYAGLADGVGGVESALTAARQELHRLHSSTFEWATLQLYVASPRADPDGPTDNRARLEGSYQRTRKKDPEYAGRLKAHLGNPSFIGGYLKLEPLGQGGFAIVSLAADLDRDQLVAIKMMRADEAVNPSRRERFDRGARMMETCHHPHIVKVFERGGEHDGRPYFVMEYIVGGDLTRHKLEPSEVLRVVEQVGSALSFAHEQGLVHRDVKPQNILLDLDGNAYLTDFDLVRADDVETGKTQANAWIGTFLYAAPEQKESASDAGAKVDVYSLGLTAVYLFNGNTLTRRVLRKPEQVLMELPVNPRVRKVLAKAIDWEEEDRYQSVMAFVEALRTAMDPRPADDAITATKLRAGGQDGTKSGDRENEPDSSTRQAPIRPNKWPVGQRWPIQIDAYQDFLREKASKVLRGLGMPVSTMHDHRASQYGELFLIGVHSDEQARVKQEVEKIGVKVHFSDGWGAMEEIVEMNRSRFSLEPEEVDVLCAQFSSMDTHEVATYLGLSHERTARHIRRLCYALQVEHADDIPKKAIDIG